MKRNLIALFFVSACCLGYAQSVDQNQQVKVQRKYQIFVNNLNVNDIDLIKETSREIEKRKSSGDRAFLSTALTAFSSSFTQRTVAATSSLLGLGVSYIQKSLNQRQQWERQVNRENYFHKVLSAETKTDDFYATPSTKDAMDPENIRFDGFGCSSLIEIDGQPHKVFHLSCKLKRDEEGINHIVNHSKFLVEVDSFYIYPAYCNLPNDSSTTIHPLDLKKRKNFTIEVKARIYASWMNAATMVIQDQQLGEFTIQKTLNLSDLDENGYFICDNAREQIPVAGDCFIVPRSYTGSLDAETFSRSWGTGQYRIEMEITQRCDINREYYTIPTMGNPEMIATMSNPGKTIWDKTKWKTEWKTIKGRKKSDSPWQNILHCVIGAYKGSGWVATIAEPIANTLYYEETKKLSRFSNHLHQLLFNEPMHPINSGSGSQKGQ